MCLRALPVCERRDGEDGCGDGCWLVGYTQITIITVKVVAVIANKNSFIIPISVTPTFLDPIGC